MTDRMPTAEAMQRMRKLLVEKNFGPQDKIPPERVLSAALGCSRETTRKVLRQLEIEGLVWRQQGKGTFMGPPASTIERPLDRIIESASAQDLMDARLVYEPALAAAAAQYATQDDLASLRKLALATGTAHDWREYERLDDAFHKAVARSSGNALLAAIFSSLASVRGRSTWQRRHDAIFREARKREYATEQSAMHLAIVDAIEARQSDRAHQAMRAHLEAIRTLALTSS
ncbi:FadR family transcriptional regulator [Ochrobactrum sp. POC9]|uniref:FadR/GntR family transcriptional regulator n=1 Tax=unclassified Ochrobactrum TaxID=239106 RepID=UPI000D707B1E|nr:FCD domain-containing protein [Ochrobactrum sp. POC9]MCH4543238.1 FCD domain-containing protein [Ochrobactrum sp. A-1]PWU72516.1 FadR family transcriptional regulator [Ochrobactrum sp. POC9]